MSLCVGNRLGNFMLNRKWRLRLKSEFKSVFDSKTSLAVKFVVVYVHRGTRKYGFIASKKVGNAVQRNRAKRLMREVIRKHWLELNEDLQIIFIARPAIKGISYIEVEKSILNALKKAGAVKKI